MRQIERLAGLGAGYDLVVVGAGPAGMAAAATAAAHGLSVLVADEAAGPGGQVYRAITTTPTARREVLGRDYWQGAALAAAFAASAADYIPGCAAWYLDETLQVGLSAGGTSRTIAARRVILATGALERPFPIKGWTLPGVMMAGAAQILLKSAGLVAAGRVVLAGSGPLIWLLAAQYLAAGAKPALILETTPRGRWRDAVRHLPGFLLSPYARKGVALMAEVRCAVKVISGVAELAVEGKASLEVTWNRTNGAAGTVTADHVLLHQGVVPNINLATAAGCALAWNEAQACWQPGTDQLGNTSLPGIAVAGDGAGIGGAEIAGMRGRNRGACGGRGARADFARGVRAAGCGGAEGGAPFRARARFSGRALSAGADVPRSGRRRRWPAAARR